MDTLNLTKRLTRAGCSFVISVPWIGGVRTSPITPEQAALLLEDPNLVHAEVAGLSVSEYHEWIALEGAVLCREHTAAGRPCRNPIKGATGLEPAVWKALSEDGGVLCGSRRPGERRLTAVAEIGKVNSRLEGGANWIDHKRQGKKWSRKSSE
jgi:hypothetical protein